MNRLASILVLEGWPTFLAGGQERSLFEVVTGLREAGVSVTVAYEQEGELVSRYESLGVGAFRIPTRHLQLKSRAFPMHLFHFALAATRIIRRHRVRGKAFELIYVNQYFDTPLAVFCGLLLGVPVVCHLRLGAPDYLSRQYRWGLRRCAKMIANSRFTAETYIKAGLPEARISVIHNGIDTDVFTPVSDTEQAALAKRANRQVLYVGRITPEKGIDVLIDAVALARQQDSRLSLSIVGNVRGAHMATQDYLSDLQARATATLGDAVRFHPATPHVVECYRDADLVVMPSRWEEPFGRVLIEAMSCGVPCIGTRVGGIPEVLLSGPDRLLVVSEDVEGLARRIIDLIDWRREDPRLGERCRAHVRTLFDRTGMMDALVQELVTATRPALTFKSNTNPA